MMAIAAEKMGDGNENHGAQRGSGEGVPETAAKNSEFHERPATNEGTHDSKNDVRDAAETAATRDFSCQPAGDQADQQPSPESVRDCNPDTSDLAQGNQCECGHSASWHTFACNWAIVVQQSIKSSGTTLRGSRARRVQERIHGKKPQPSAGWCLRRQRNRPHANP